MITMSMMARVQAALLISILLAGSYAAAARPATAHIRLEAHRRHSLCNPQIAFLTSEFTLSSDKSLGHIVANFPTMVENGTWLQIGSNSLEPTSWASAGIVDPLLEYLPMYAAYRKIFIEPLPSVFNLLQKNTENMTNAYLINAAIVAEDSTEDTIKMYCPETKATDNLNSKLMACSMSRATAAKGGEQLVETEVEALTVKKLFLAHDIQNVRVLSIDIEGFDVKVLKMMPWESAAFQPEIVVFEFTHVSSEEHEEAKELLREHCYVVWSDWENTYAIKATPAIPSVLEN